jgi:hypothetical protein
VQSSAVECSRVKTDVVELVGGEGEERDDGEQCEQRDNHAKRHLVVPARGGVEGEGESADGGSGERRDKEGANRREGNREDGHRGQRTELREATRCEPAHVVCVGRG